MSAQILSFPRAFTPRIAHAWRATAGADADLCGVRVKVVIPGAAWTVVDYSDGEGTWRQQVQTRLLRPWCGQEGKLPARLCEEAAGVAPCDTEQPEPPRAA